MTQRKRLFRRGNVVVDDDGFLKVENVKLFRLGPGLAIVLDRDQRRARARGSPMVEANIVDIIEVLVQYGEQ